MDSSEVCDALSCQFPFSSVESLPIFEVWSHSSVTYFPVHVVCLHFPAFRWEMLEGKAKGCPSGLPLAPRFMRGSWGGRQGLKGPGCTELLSERWWYTHWPYCNIYSSKAKAKQQSLQQAGSHSGLGAGEFAFCICWCSCCWFSGVSGYLFTISFLQYLILIKGNRRWLSGRWNQFGLGHGICVKSFSCLLARVHEQSKLPGRESSENVLYLGCTDFFIIIIISFYFL